MNNEQKIRIDIATKDQRELAFSVRKKVFVDEIGIPEEKEFGLNDDCAVHILAYIEQKEHKIPVGTMRIRFFADFVKFERMAVLPSFRKSNVTDAIMQYGFNYVSEKGYQQVYGLCREDLLLRWQKCGYQRIEGAELVEENGMTLIPICRKLEKNSKALSMASHPSLLIADEGHWFDESGHSSKQNFTPTALDILNKNQKVK